MIDPEVLLTYEAVAKKLGDANLIVRLDPTPLWLRLENQRVEILSDPIETDYVWGDGQAFAEIFAANGTLARVATVSRLYRQGKVGMVGDVARLLPLLNRISR